MAVMNTVNAHSEAVGDALRFFNDLIKDLNEKNDFLNQQLQTIQLDYESEVKQRRALQLANHTKSELLSKNNYVIVLIDGDGMIFQDALLQQGGKEAGKRILKQTKDTISKFYGDIEGSTAWKIQVKIFASVAKISEILSRSKGITNFRDFVVEFNQSDPFLHFVDVGMGKEMTDDRIKGHLHWHLENYNCKAVFLAASHDNGYARDLSTINSHSRGDKVVLVEGPPFGREFAQFNYRKAPWHDIFLSEKLVDPRTLPPLSPTPPTPNNIIISPKLSQARTMSESSGSGTGFSIDPRPGPRPSAAADPSGFSTVSYAKATTKSPPPGFAEQASETPRSATATSWRTASEQKKPTVTTLKAPRPEIFDQLKALRPRACNDHYLRGCTRQECPFGHNHKLNDEQVNALKYFARQVRCNYGVDCRNETCTAGHGCKAPLDSYGRCSRGDRCKFPMSEHPGREEYY